jgi:hypothetical protein
VICRNPVLVEAKDMQPQQPFTLRMFVAEGDPEGLRLVERSNWVGKAVVFPRASLSGLKRRPEFDQTGVYLLLGPEEDGEGSRIYVGEGDPVRPRLESHHAQKDFWTQAVFFVSTQGQLNKAHVQFLEARLISLAKDAKRSVLDNTQMPSEPSLSEADRAEMEVFLANMLGILPVLGVTAFDRPSPRKEDKRPRLFLKAKGISAEGYEAPRGFTVLASSTAVRATTPSFNESNANAKALRDHLIKSGVLVPNGEHLMFSSDFSFNSPSLASSVIIGNASNGRTAWRDKAGRTLKELQESESITS